MPLLHITGVHSLQNSRPGYLSAAPSARFCRQSGRSGRKTPLDPPVVELLRHAEASRPASILPKVSIILSAGCAPTARGACFVPVTRKGQAFATGAIVLHDGWAEIKRMWVEEAARGRGIARQILNALVAEAGGAASNGFAWRPGSPIMPHWPCTKRQASNVARRSPTIAPIQSACSWNDSSNAPRRPSATVPMRHAPTKAN